MKKIIIIPFFLIIILSLGNHFAGKRVIEQEKTLFLQNVEALAQREGNQVEYGEFPDGKKRTRVCNATIDGGRCKVELTLCEGGGKGCVEIRCYEHSK